MTPRRIQLRRTKGWRKPPAPSSSPARPAGATPYSVAEHGQAGAVTLYCQYLAQHPDAARRELAGKTLACWCPPDQPCHADVHLEVANPRHQPERP